MVLQSWIFCKWSDLQVDENKGFFGEISCQKVAERYESEELSLIYGLIKYKENKASVREFLKKARMQMLLANWACFSPKPSPGPPLSMSKKD